MASSKTAQQVGAHNASRRISAHLSSSSRLISAHLGPSRRISVHLDFRLVSAHLGPSRLISGRGGGEGGDGEGGGSEDGGKAAAARGWQRWQRGRGERGHLCYGDGGWAARVAATAAAAAAARAASSMAVAVAGGSGGGCGGGGGVYRAEGAMRGCEWPGASPVSPERHLGLGEQLLGGAKRGRAARRVWRDSTRPVLHRRRLVSVQGRGGASRV